MSLTVRWAVRVGDVKIARRVRRGYLCVFAGSRVFPPWTLQAAKFEICCLPLGRALVVGGTVFIDEQFRRRRTGNSGAGLLEIAAAISKVRFRDGPAAVTELDSREHSVMAIIRRGE